MQSHSARVVQVFDRELNSLKQRSVDLDQETRISIYLFDDKIECLTFDMDVMRFKSLAGYYKVRGSTALLDAVVQSIDDNIKLPQMYGDHAFLQYVITDGMENASKTRREVVSRKLGALPDNWTSAVLVPDNTGATYAESFGFNGGSIAIWDTTRVDALDRVGSQFTNVMENYMQMRASGVRGTKGLFTLDSSGLATVSGNLKEVSPREYRIIPVTRDASIRDYVEQALGTPYKIGSVYYQPVKKVTIQEYKDIFVQKVSTGQVFTGANIRGLLGLPNSTVDVDPGQHNDWRIFVQSTSTNRRLFAGTSVLVRS